MTGLNEESVPYPLHKTRSRRSSTTAARDPATSHSSRASDPSVLEIEQTLDAGHDVTLLRDGRPWATIAPA